MENSLAIIVVFLTLVLTNDKLLGFIGMFSSLLWLLETISLVI